MSRETDSVTVGFVALGCPKNIVDSERMLAEIARAGWIICAEPENAQVIVINTCGFIAPAKAEAIEEIRRAVECKKNGIVKKVIVAGCLPQRIGKQLFKEVQGIDAVMGLGQRDRIVQIIEKTLHSGRTWVFLEEGGQRVPDDSVRLPVNGTHSMYLRISEGCNHKCTFCTIPSIRGRFRSKPFEQVVCEAKELASAGAVELTIIGQDTTYYGRDFNEKDALPKLLEKISAIEGLRWIRLMYSYPHEITEGLIKTISDNQKVLPYLDIPVQHINERILKAMGRRDTGSMLCSLIEKLRAGIPGIVLRTTLIAGFPGESDEEFGELVEFVRWAQFDSLGCFRYYAENGTKAARMGGQVPEYVKEQRQEEIMLTQQEIAFEKARARIGIRLECLIDACVPGEQGRGRFYGQAPEIDSICIVRNCSASEGDLINAKVVDSKEYDLIVEQL